MSVHRITLASFAASPAGFQNVSLLTGGIEAAGHGLFVDEATIDGAMRAVLGKSVRAYLKHAGAFGDRLGEEIGFFSGIFRDGLQLRAANFEYLESWKSANADMHAKLVELAAKAPDQFGVSLVLEHSPVWVMSDGTEKPARMGEKAPKGAVRELPSMRVRSVMSADLVQRPAANPNGLLSSTTTVDVPPNNETKTMAENIQTITLEVHAAEVAALNAKLEQSAKDGAAALDALKSEHAAALEKQAGEYKSALEKLTAEKDEAHKAELAKLGEEHKAALAKAEAEGAAKLGVPPVVIKQVNATLAKLPKPGVTDRERWDQYAELLSTDEDAALAFRSTYLSR